MEPTFDLLTRLVDACGCELRIRVTEIDWSGREPRDPVDFETRLRELKTFSAFELDLTRR